MRYSDIIWDFDGTIADSCPKMARAYAKALNDLGSPVAPSGLLPVIKRKVMEAAALYAPLAGVGADELLLRLLDAERAEAGGLPPYAGVAETLRDICSRGG